MDARLVKSGLSCPLRASVWQRLDHLQFTDDAPVVVIDQLPIGYGGQLSRRIMGLKVGLALGRKAVFISDADSPYVQSLIRPFSWDTARLVNETPPRLLILGDDPRPLVMFEYCYVRKTLALLGLTVEEWVSQRFAAIFAPSDDDLKKIDGWIFAWLRFIPEFEERLERDRSRLGVSQSTLGVHLRRGDKHIESAYVPAAYFNDAIRRIYENWPFNTLFLASDDPKAPAALNLPYGVRLIFDAREKRYNNANHKMLMVNPDLAAHETYIAFKNLHLLAACGGIVGQDNAHFATIAASYVLQRDSNPERVTLLEGRIAEARSAQLRLLYGAKRGIRDFVKRIVPRQALRFIVSTMHRRGVPRKSGGD
jgi:hypothetical protein